MRNTFLFYLIIIVPLAVLIYLTGTDRIPNAWFAGLLIAYAIIYRPITDYLRLLSKNIIGKNDFWKTFMPSFRISYFRALYFS